MILGLFGIASLIATVLVVIFISRWIYADKRPAVLILIILAFLDGLIAGMIIGFINIFPHYGLFENISTIILGAILWVGGIYLLKMPIKQLPAEKGPIILEQDRSHY